MEEFARSEAKHGDASDDSVLAEEAAEDPSPDIGQVPGQMFSLLTVVEMTGLTWTPAGSGEAQAEALPGLRTVELHQGVDQALGNVAALELYR